AAFIILFLFRRDSYKLELETSVHSAQERLLIAERKFMQGKLKRSVFESLRSMIEEEMLLAEMSLFRLKKASNISVSTKAKRLVEVSGSLSRRKETKVRSILKETELLRSQMGLLEARFLKRSISEYVFEKLITNKESELIKKERELSNLISN
ncbi:MAG: hypothetical protein NTY48_00335, partial [Candidatus Diapherotrites archaeon]|nr:hypothetical protein [Candidatus Diapherotrites archaeon]